MSLTSACIEWTGTKDEAGYGIVYVPKKKKMQHAHRVVWSIAHKKRIPKGLFICHHCDNPPCVNPEHLFLGDRRLNMQDMWAKKRSHVHNPRTVPTQKIRSMRQGGKSIREIAQELQVFPPTIRSILKAHPVYSIQEDASKERLRRWGLSSMGVAVYLKLQRERGHQMGISAPF